VSQKNALIPVAAEVKKRNATPNTPALSREKPNCPEE